MKMKMIILNGVTVRTLEENLVDEAVASLRAVLPDANIVVIEVLDTPPPNDLASIE